MTRKRIRVKEQSKREHTCLAISRSRRLDGIGKPAVAIVLSALVSVALATAPAEAQATFSAPTSFGVGGGPNSVAAGDLNGDGYVDLVTSHANSANVAVLLGNGGGGFTGPTYFAADYSVSVAVGDVNIDGRLDVITPAVLTNRVLVLLGDGLGGLSAPTAFATGTNPAAVTTADVNLDGRLDLAVANNGGNSVSVLLATGAGTFSSAIDIPVSGGPTAVAARDVNGDGNPDLIVPRQATNILAILLGDGRGGFSPTGPVLVGSIPVAVAMGDVDNDGALDLSVANAGSDTVSVLLGTGSDDFPVGMQFPAGLVPYAVALGDWDFDGNLDLAVANRQANAVSVLIGDGTGQFSSPTPLAADNRPSSIAAADVNGDGKPDLVVANAGSNNVSVLLNTTNRPPSANGDTYTTPQNAPLVVPAPGVLGNDLDPDGDAMTAEVVSPPVGAVTLNTNGSFTYTPQASFSGPDSFTYRAGDGTTLSAPVTVSIMVTGTNRAPVASPDAYITDENTTLTIAAPGLLANDSDVDGDRLGAVVVTGPSHGTLALNADGAFTYIPAGGYAGADSFSYQATDGSLVSNTVTVALTVRYLFTGFFAPVDPPPVFNGLNAGQAIPVKFTLNGDKGLNILASGYPISQPIACSGATVVDDIEQTAAAATSTLTYDAASNQYTYTWKTEKAWKNSCRQLTVKLADGTTHVAIFRFK